MTRKTAGATRRPGHHRRSRPGQDEGPPPWPPGRQPPLRWPRWVLMALLIAGILAVTYVIAARAGSHMTDVPPSPSATYTPAGPPDTTTRTGDTA